MERTTRRLALTEAGETFHRRMRGALSALQEIEQDTAATAASVRGTLRIAPRDLRADVGHPASWPPIPT